VKPSRLSKALQGHYKRAGLAPKRDIREFRVGIEGIELGATSRSTASRRAIASTCKGSRRATASPAAYKALELLGRRREPRLDIHRQPGSNGDTNAGHTPRGSHRPGHYASTASRTRTSKSSGPTRSATCCSSAAPSGTQERPGHRAAVGEEQGDRIMAQVIDAKGKVVRDKRPRRRSAARPTVRRTRSTAPSSASWRTRAPERRRPRSATKCAAAVASRGVKRHRARPLGFDPLAAVGARRRRLRTAAALVRLEPQQEGTPRRDARRVSDKFQTRRDRARHDLARPHQDQGLARAVRFAQGREDGKRTLVVFATEELASVGAFAARTGANLPRVAVTHTGELDVKDVVGNRAARPHHGCPRRARRQVHAGVEVVEAATSSSLRSSPRSRWRGPQRSSTPSR